MSGRRRPVARRVLRLGRVLARVALGCGLLVALELALDVTALSLFPHHDTAACAGADTFCAPDGAPGPTGGALVVAVGNLVAALTVAAVLVLVVIRRRVAPRRS